MSPATSRRLWLAKLVVLAASMVVALLCVELFVRLTGRDAPLVFEPEPKVGWWHVPNATSHWTTEGDGWIRINSVRLRDPERTLAKPAGVYRVAVFGDSMTEGVQVNVDQTFTQLLEARLRKRGLNVEVLNFGVNGYSALQAYLLYKHFGKAFDPDLIVHAVFTDNDIADGDPALATGQGAAPFVHRGSSGELRVDYSPAEASYASYHGQPAYAARRLLATYRMLSFRRALRQDAQRAGATKAAAGGVHRRYLLYAEPLDAAWQDAWVTYERILDAFASDVTAAGRKFAVLSMPAGQVVDPQVWDRLVSENAAMTPMRWRPLDPEERLRGLTEKRGVTYLAPLDAFREQIKGEPLFFGGIGHLTPRGHEVLAAFLEHALETQQLLR